MYSGCMVKPGVKLWVEMPMYYDMDAFILGIKATSLFGDCLPCQIHQAVDAGISHVTSNMNYINAIISANNKTILVI